jgi:aconitate hydratase
MGKNIVEKLIEKYIVKRRENKIRMKIGQTLTQDATGTTAYLQFEVLGTPKVKTELSVSCIGHNTLQTDFRNPDERTYLQSIASKTFL